MAKAKKKIKEDLVRLNLTFEEAVKKALNTPLPAHEKLKTKKKYIKK